MQRRRTVFLLCLLLGIIVASGSTWLYLNNEQAKENRRQRQLVQKRERERLESAAAAERKQFVSHWIGQAKADLESGRLEPAIAATDEILRRYPDEPEAKSLWNAAIRTKAKASDLLKLAIARDHGQYDQQALDWLREASALAPTNLEIAKALARISAYVRTIRVPGDFATPVEALAIARDRDCVILNADTWQGPLVINTAIELRGGDSTLTMVECSPEDGSAITIGPDAKGATVSGITFRHPSFATGTERFAVALVRGGSATFTDCRFTEASGHGLAVIEGGQATLSRCRFTDNGWDGAATFGHGSRLEVKDSEATNNVEHGFEAWDGAALTLINNRCEANHRNGIHADCGPSSAVIEGNQLIANREFGLVLDSASNGKITSNTARNNQLGGIVVRAAAANLPLSANTIIQNQGPGLILEKGLAPAAYLNNSVSQNKGQDILPEADLDPNESPKPDPAR